jgi:voltage-gated sodium channel
MLTLFRIITGDAWEVVMYGCRAEVPGAPAYFLAFVVIANMVMLNLFIAVILVRTGGVSLGAVYAF